MRIPFDTPAERAPKGILFVYDVVVNYDGRGVFPSHRVHPAAAKSCFGLQRRLNRTSLRTRLGLYT